MQVAEGLEWLNIYWTRGSLPKFVDLRNSISDPPCSGWQSAFVMRGEKHSTIFCPYTFRAWSVPTSCGEIVFAKELKEDFRSEYVVSMLKNRWAQLQSTGQQKDYDTCAIVFTKMKLPIPAQVMVGGLEDTRKKGGKTVGTKLKKPVKADSKRGKFLQWFIDGEGSRSVREAMIEFSMTRSNALSYLYMLRKDHGIGYELVGDTATIQMPDGCETPFDTPAIVEEEDDDSWLD